jgi:hypothetical protein
MSRHARIEAVNSGNKQEERMKSPRSVVSLQRFILAAVLGLCCLAVVQGCRGRKHSAGVSKAAADNAALEAVMKIQGDAARFLALEKFVREHGSAAAAGQAHAMMVELAAKQAPDRVQGILREFLTTEYASPDPYNMVGWDLAVAGEHLDIAVPILQKAVAKARAARDTMNLAACLDSEAWARYRAGDAKAAVAPMEESRRLFGKPQDEIDVHMGLIYEAAGMAKNARPICLALLGHMEDPDIRAALKRIVAAAGGSMADVNAEINRTRIAGATPSADFKLPVFGGGVASLADYRGKVVLLNFWRYT